MKFGIMNLFPAGWGENDHEVFEHTLEEIEAADEMGFDSVWLAEHHFSRYGILGDPLNFGAAIAARTKHITIGTAVAVVPFHHPIRLAENALSLDALSQGRLMLGLGRGYQPKEFKGFNVDPADSVDLYNETVDILKLAFNEEDWSYHGKHYQFEDLTIYPRPVTPGGPKLVHGAVSPGSFRARGLAGESIITSPNFTPLPRMKANFDAYREALVEAGHDPADFELPFMQQIWCGPDESGLEAAATAALNYYQTVGKVIPGSEDALESERAYYEAVRNNIKLLTVEQTMTHGGNFGSTDRVVELIGTLEEQLGVNHYIGWFRIPTLDRSLALKSMEVFASEVMPQLKAA